MDSDEWFKRWRRNLPFGPWPFPEMDEMIKEIERSFAESFKDIEKDIPKNLVRERRLSDGSTRKEIGPIVYGYSVTIGPDGKPVVREFGNVKRGGAQPWKEIQDKREPLVDVVASDRDVKLIAEIPGVQREDIDVTVTEQRVTISVDTENRKYYKELNLPELVKPEGAKSSYNNGILEITLPLKTAKGGGVRLKVE
jgi:HSP20 family protein